MSRAALALVLGFASLALAHYGPGGQNSPNGEHDSGSNGNGINSGTPFGSSPFSGGKPPGFGARNKALIAHGILASLAFVIFFPLGSILVRVGSFRGLWLIHGLFQLFAFLVYIAAFGLGVWLTQQGPFNLIGFYHPVIGIVVFVLLFFQPVLGVVHHFKYKKLGRRTWWSHAHLWTGRVTVTLGIINGGLGLLFAFKSGYGRPSIGQIIAYGVVSGVMWLAWVGAAIWGERKSANERKETVVVHKEEEFA